MVTIFELFALMFMVCVPILMGKFVANHLGVLTGIGAGVLSAVVCVTAVALLYRARGRRHEQQRRQLREKYLRIYRIVAIPTNQNNIKKLQGAEIKVGDYGWEAEPPNRTDGLIYLQGLTDKWQVVWYAGFHPDQLESVGSKPRSQYDWDSSWIRNAPACPFPVQERETASMGLPDAWGWNGPKRK